LFFLVYTQDLALYPTCKMRALLQILHQSQGGGWSPMLSSSDLALSAGGIELWDECKRGTFIPRVIALVISIARLGRLVPPTGVLIRIFLCWHKKIGY